MANGNSSDEELNSYLNDSGDSDYDPLVEHLKSGKKIIPDYFNIREKDKSSCLTKKNTKTPEPDTSIINNNKDNNILIRPSTSASPLVSDVSMSSQSSSSSTRDNDNITFYEKEHLQQKYSYLDGKYFKVLAVNGKNLQTQCQLCQPKEHIIRGILGVSTNFLKHINKVHSQSLKAYQDYVKMKKSIDREDKRKTDRILNTSQGSSDFEESKSKRIKKQQTLQSSFSSIRNVSQTEFDNRIIKFVVSSMSSINVLENQDFINIFNGMNLKVISRKTAMRRINDLNNKKIQFIQDHLQQVKYVCTTTDIWSTKKRSFLGVTCHWIDSELNRHSVALACKRFSGTHSYDKIAELLDEIHSKFKLDNKKIIATVTDNGSNFIKAFKEFGVTFSSNIIQQSLEADGAQTVHDNPSHEDTNEENEDNNVNEDNNDENDEDEIELPCFTRIVTEGDEGSTADAQKDTNTSASEEEIIIELHLPKHRRCASHTINLIAVTDIKNAINCSQILRSRHTSAMYKCSLLWNKSSYPKSAEIIKELLGHYLSYPGITRWNSHFDAVSQILKDSDKLNELFQKLNIKNSFKETEIAYLEEYCKILQPLASTLDILQGDKNTYYGYLLPCVASLQVKLNKLKNENLRTTVTAPILNACIDGLHRRFLDFLTLTENADDAIIAAFTIPKFKLRWFHALKKNSVRDLEAIQKMIINVAQKVCESQPQSEMDCDVEENMNKLSTEEDAFFDFEAEFDNTLKNRTEVASNIDLEILQYIQDSRNALEIINNYPIVKKLFIKYNTCLPSSASVERMFSFASIINAPKRHALTDQNFENLVLLKANKHIP